MREDFLHYLWNSKEFNLNGLQLTDGRPIQIIRFGRHNKDAGPDFLEARVRIAQTLWVGNIELHLKSSDWLLHQHQHDSAYNNVILHVVWEEDRSLFRENGERIPCLELCGKIPPEIYTRYKKILTNQAWIPCQIHFSKVPERVKVMWLERLLIERMEEKTKKIEENLRFNNFSWAETFYQTLARNFGAKKNSPPFELLAKSIPLPLLAKHRDQPLQVAALLFGQAGFLDENFKDEYPLQLKKEFQFLKKKYQLLPLKKENWKFLRMRPANFPTIRIAQFAALMVQSTSLFSRILEAESLVELADLFQINISEYWHTHYLFDRSGKVQVRKPGKAIVDSLVINAIVPVLFLYGQYKYDESFTHKALRFLDEMAPEKNEVIKKWMDLGFIPCSAGQTQGLLQLKNEFCDKKRCLSCAVGSQILRR